MLKSLRTRIAKAISPSPVTAKPYYPALQAPRRYPEYKGSRSSLLGDQKVMGRSGLKYFYPGWIRDELLTDLQGTKKYQVFKEMGDMNGYCAAALNAFAMFLRRAKWRVDPVVDENKDNGSAQFLEECMRDMEHSWQTFIAIVSRNVPQMGFAPFEIIYKIRGGDNENEKIASRFDDGRIGWQNFAIRAPETIFHWVWYPDDPSRLRGLVQLTPPDYPGDLFIPIEKILLLRAEPGDENPEGRSVLRSSYKPFVTSKYSEDIRNVIMERGGSGIPCADVPAAISNPYSVDPATGEVKLDGDGNPIVDYVALATLTSIQNTLENMRQGDQPWIIRPVEYQVDGQGNPTGNKLFDITFLTNNGGSMLGEINNIVKDEGMKILMSTMSEFLALGTNATGGGSFALSRDKTDNFTLAITSYLDAFEESINNQAVRRLFKLNPEFDNLEVLPRIVHDPIIPVNISEVSAVLAGFKGIGWDLTKEANAEEIKNAILDAVGLPKAAQKDEADNKGEGGGEKKVELPEEELKIPPVKETEAVKPEPITEPGGKAEKSAVPFAKWDESDHPRAESGSKGGQFVARGESSAGSGGSNPKSDSKSKKPGGKDLADRMVASGKTDNLSLAKDLGFTGVPTVLSNQDFEKEVSNGDYVVGYRGLASDDHAAAFESGDYFEGTDGVFGKGIYVAIGEDEDARSVAEYFAKKNGAIVKVALPKDAKIIDGHDLLDERGALVASLKRESNDLYKKLQSESGIKDYHQLAKRYPDEFRQMDVRDDIVQQLSKDDGYAAKMLGYDAVVFDTGSADKQMTVLNRSILKTTRLARGFVKSAPWRSVATIDDKTCDKCKENNGKVFNFEPEYKSIWHPNCRCVKEKV